MMLLQSKMSYEWVKNFPQDRGLMIGRVKDPS